MNADTFDFLFSGDNWAWGNVDGFPHRILEHLQYSAIALVIAFLIAFPIGLIRMVPVILSRGAHSILRGSRPVSGKSPGSHRRPASRTRTS